VHEIVIAAGVFLLTLVMTVSLAVGLFVRSLSRSNRVVADRRSPAPMTWLWSWATAARLHRRLRRAAQTVSCVVAPLRPPSRRRQRPNPGPSPLVDVADALLARIVDIDERLVAASRVAPRWRAGLVADLGQAVADVEESVAHLGRVTAAWGSQMEAAARYEPVPPLDVRSRLDAVEAALLEVAHAGRAGAGAPAVGTERPLSA
jgi:hypothetical protein